MSKPIRIAQVIGKMKSGGVESVVMNYFQNIDRSKVQYDFIIDEDSTCIPKEQIERLGGRIYIVPPYQKLHKYIPALVELFKRNNYQIVHSHINSLSVFPLYAAKKAGVQVRIAHSHSTANKSEFKKTAMKYALRPLSKIYPTHYVACSALAGKWLFGNQTFNRGEVKLIQNAIDISRFSYDDETKNIVRKELGINDEFVIGHVGRFTSQKNHSFLIDIFHKIRSEEPKSVLLLVGQGELEQDIKDKVKDLGLSNNVKFLGNRNDVHKLMHAMDLFLLPSLYEGLPVVGVEAQTAGLPCIYSSNVTDETKILNTTEFISLNDPVEKWADKVLSYKDSFVREKVDKEIINAGFEINSASEDLLNYYTKLVNF